MIDFTLKILRFFPYIYSRFYWFLLQKTFHKIGENTYAEFPLELKGGKYITIGNGFKAKKRLQLEAHDNHNGKSFSPEIIIGDDVSINYDVHIGCINKIVIEDGVLIASKVFITDHFHGKINENELFQPPGKRILHSKGPVHIKKNAWIGEGVAILPGVEIGENTIVGANAVVTKSIPDNCVAAGNPAQIIKRLR